jgi:hypothetical protein
VGLAYEAPYLFAVSSLSQQRVKIPPEKIGFNGIGKTYDRVSIYWAIPISIEEESYGWDEG